MAEVPNRAHDSNRQLKPYVDEQGREVTPIDTSGMLSSVPTEGMDDITITVGKKRRYRGKYAAPAPKPDPETSYHEIQLKKGDGRWSTAYTYNGRGVEALNHYKGINVGNGYSKRFNVDGRTVHTTHS
jgi:hypothetical protein